MAKAFASRQQSRGFYGNGFRKACGRAEQGGFTERQGVRRKGL